MQYKKVFLLVDNRHPSSPDPLDLKNNSSNDFRGSAFKATQVDFAEQQPQNNYQDCLLLSQLQKRVQVLEQKMRRLQHSENGEYLKKKKRRKAVQISRQFECPNKECGKLYGSETSLKNHIKLKHGSRN